MCQVNIDRIFSILKQFLVLFLLLWLLFSFKLFIMEMFKQVQTKKNGVMNFHVPINDLQ